MARPDPLEVLKATFLPRIQFSAEFLSLVVASIGTSLSALLAVGGTGFAIMAIIVATARGWVSRRSAVDRIARMLFFLERCPRYHGMFPHFLNGRTGETIHFQRKDGADLVETALLFQGLICARQYASNTRTASPIRMAMSATDLTAGGLSSSRGPAGYIAHAPQRGHQRDHAECRACQFSLSSGRGDAGAAGVHEQTQEPDLDTVRLCRRVFRKPELVCENLSRDQPGADRHHDRELPDRTVVEPFHGSARDPNGPDAAWLWQSAF